VCVFAGAQVCRANPARNVEQLAQGAAGEPGVSQRGSSVQDGAQHTTVSTRPRPEEQRLQAPGSAAAAAAAAPLHPGPMTRQVGTC